MFSCIEIDILNTLHIVRLVRKYRINRVFPVYVSRESTNIFFFFFRIGGDTSQKNKTYVWLYVVGFYKFSRKSLEIKINSFANNSHISQCTT